VARYSGSSCKLCRREGAKLFLKGTRCVGKCPFDKRSYSPGQHGQRQRRQKLSDYGLQLREKQKVKRIYGVLEQQFRLYFKRAAKSRGITGEILLQLLERRLDNVIFRLCFGVSRQNGRQIVRHGFVEVNGKNVDIPSYTVAKGDVIKINAKDKMLKKIKDGIETVKDRGVPKWLKADYGVVQGEVMELPAREDVGFPIKEQLIVELYSK